MNAELIQKAVQQTMNNYYGLASFKFLTTDNGSEFSTLSLIESEIAELKVFFTHAYASWEKGTNERHNGLLKEFVPKGKSLKTLKYNDLKMYTDSINNRPRRIQNYETPTLLVIKDNNISFYPGNKTEELSDIFEINQEDS